MEDKNAVVLGQVKPEPLLWDDERIIAALGEGIPLWGEHDSWYSRSAALRLAKAIRDEYEAKLAELYGEVVFLRGQSEVLVRFVEES